MEASAMESVCNFFSLTVVGLCLVMKVPQIWSAFKAGNTNGISLESVLLEQCGYSIMLSYSFAMEYPVVNYLETAFLLMQNFFLLGLIIHTRDLLSPKVFIFFVLYMAVYLSIANKFLPDVLMKAVISLNTPLSVSSKLTQILALYKSKDPGRLSAKTWSIAAYGCYVRIFTNLVQTGDPFIIMNFSSGAFLNTVMVAMILYYTQQKRTKLNLEFDSIERVRRMGRKRWRLLRDLKQHFIKDLRPSVEKNPEGKKPKCSRSIKCGVT